MDKAVLAVLANGQGAKDDIKDIKVDRIKHFFAGTVAEAQRFIEKASVQEQEEEEMEEEEEDD